MLSRLLRGVIASMKRRFIVSLFMEGLRLSFSLKYDRLVFRVQSTKLLVLKC